MSTFRRVVIAVPALSLLAVSTALVVPAAADSAVGCGAVITKNTTLTQDIGPCPGDGLVVRGSNIRIDLGGHTITGAHGSQVQEQPAEHVGIRLMDASGVTVQNGEVHNFDSGVAIGRGSGNTVRGLYVHHNINHSALGGAINACDFGDGITVVGSDRNRVAGNRVANNGPLSGIALVGDSDANQLTGNQVSEQNIKALTPSGEGILCGTGDDQGPMGNGREVQNIGIRVEGPGANDNRVSGNSITNNALAGVAVHGNVCGDTPDAPKAPPNDGTAITGNQISATGKETHQDDPQANGIALLASGPAAIVCVASNAKIVGNDSSGNFANGIYVGGRGSHHNKIAANTVNSNRTDGIHLDGPPNAQIPGTIQSNITGNRASGNSGMDGFDGTENCGSNKWRGNSLTRWNQPCVGGR